MIELATDDLRIEVEPDHGGAITSLIDRRTGYEILFQPPWTVDRAAARGSGNEAWAAGWAGGWNLLFPNAGEACRVGVDDHGYHGAASVEPWQFTGASSRSARLVFRGAGFAVERVLEIVERAVHVRTVVRNESEWARAFVAVEHAVFGGALAAPGSRVDRQPARDDDARLAWRLVVPEGPGGWFETSTTEGGSSTRLTAADGSVSVVVQARGLSALWLWAEQQATRSPPWLGRTSCVGIEPSTSSVTGGLATAIADGSASWLARGGEAVFGIELLVESP